MRLRAQTTQNSLDYVVEGETITYTITVTNTGDLGKDVTVRDNIPDRNKHLYKIV